MRSYYIIIRARRLGFGLLLNIFLVSMIASCNTVKQMNYFSDINRDTIIVTPTFPLVEPKIKIGDVLSISIASISPEASSIFNGSVGINNTSTATSSGAYFPGYNVDEDGNIEIIKIGKIHAAGLVRNDLKNKIEKLLFPFLKDPVVIIRFLNQKVTIIGEVGHVSIVPISQQRISLIDALTSSGDISKTGKMNNVLIIRETDSTKILKKINLSISSILTSPYYYLLPNDIVYVEPKKDKSGLSPQTVQLITIGLSAVSLILVLIKGFK